MSSAFPYWAEWHGGSQPEADLALAKLATTTHTRGKKVAGGMRVELCSKDKVDGQCVWWVWMWMWMDGWAFVCVWNGGWMDGFAPRKIKQKSGREEREGIHARKRHKGKIEIQFFGRR